MAKLRPGLLTGKFGNTFYQKCHHTHLHMSFQATGQTMIHRVQLQLSAFEGAKAAFNDTQTLVCAGGIFRREGVIIGLDNLLAISPSSLPDGFPVQANLCFLRDGQVALGTWGSQQVNGPLRGD